MGGFALKCPDFPEFPIDGLQLACLVKHQYVDLSGASKNSIRDKNNADGFVRFTTVLQIVWFSVQCLGRAFQVLGLSSLELTVVANIFGTISSFVFWNHKPLDIEDPLVLYTSVPMSRILLDAKDLAQKPYSRTPLDFVRPARTRPNLTSTCWLGLQQMFNREKDPPGRPIRSIDNTHTMPHRHYHDWDIAFFVIFPLTFFDIHLIAWNFTFPSRTEALLWKIASKSLIYINIMHYGLVHAYTFHPEECGMTVAGKPTKDIYVFYEVAPRWLIIPSHWIGFCIYFTARLYILAEGWTGLRALQMRVFLSVNWSNYIPHVN